MEHSIEAEQGLFEALRRAERDGDTDEALKLRNRIVLDNMGWVVTRARSFYSTFLTDTEIIQEGVLGLFRAIAKFDHTRGVRFATYSRNWIDYQIRRALYNNDTTVRNPERNRKKQPRLECIPLQFADLSDYFTTQGEHYSLDWGVAKHCVAALSERDRYILQRRFDAGGDEDATLQAIGDELGVSRECIRIRLGSALAALRAQLGVEVGN